MQIRSCAAQENVADLLQIAGEEGALCYDLIGDILTIWGVPLDLDYALRSDAAGVRKLALFFAVAKESPQAFPGRCASPREMQRCCTDGCSTRCAVQNPLCPT